MSMKHEDSPNTYPGEIVPIIEQPGLFDGSPIRGFDNNR